MTRVLVLGGSGMLGSKVYEVLSKRFVTVATSRTADHQFIHLDAMNFGNALSVLKHVDPDVVINCVGVLKDETDPITSITVNALLPHQLAKFCKRLIHISTDCVFSGRMGYYTEDDIPDPEDLYGRTKLLGEVRQGNCLTLRTSFIGREGGLLKWFLDNDGGKVRGYTNAIFSGLTTQVLAFVIVDLIEKYPSLSGLYHVSGNPISKYDLLVKIRDIMQLDIEIEPYDNFHCNRSLNSSLFSLATSYFPYSWDGMISGYDT